MLQVRSGSDTVTAVQVVFSDEEEGHMDADDCARIIEGDGSRARFACGRRGCRGRPGADLRAACGEVPARTRGTRSYDGVRVACMPDRGRSLARWRVSNVSAHADPITPDSDGRASRRGGAWPAVSGASVSARLTPCRRGGSDICGRDMKMAATVFRWRPSWRVFACCRLYAFLSARRS